MHALLFEEASRKLGKCGLKDCYFSWAGVKVPDKPNVIAFLVHQATEFTEAWKS